MKIKQLSVFLQNKLGRFSEMATILGEAGINMQAFTVAENAEFGIVRLIVGDPERAARLLIERSFAVSVGEVFLLEMPDEPGALAARVNKLSDAGVFIEYMYAFSGANGKAVVALKPSDAVLCEKVLGE
ncbi:MAG: amino acid-binding protein [Bacteroidaceae bacterium]|jgi:hypothetical protein|nr:amino acid-binding protein [Bacteroidaceae bacterium]